MRVQFRCDECQQTSSSPVDADARSVACAHCGASIRFPADAMRDGEIQRCLVCPSSELFIRKDFSQRLGISIIIAGFIASSIALAMHHSLLSLGILISTALLDAAVFLCVGNVLTCYRCHSEYRDIGATELHPGFSLEVHERYRQQAARLAEAERATGERRAEMPAGPSPAGAAPPSGT